ncbi:MAG: helix-turn-helix domain-containing protein [Candidatus Binataceae bacterium]|nr:helix-turn-helix domain-containing protein [Candidatus Binataceae bacterium]
MKLTQTQAAERLGINSWTVLNWERGHTEPPIESMPAILRFLDYDPFPEPESLQGLLLAKRRAMGWSIKKAARQLGVDEGTWGDWERGETILFLKHRVLVARFLGLPADAVHRDMGDRWNLSHQKARVPNA